MREYNLFISHSWDYPDAYKFLKTMLDEAPYFNYKDYSVPEEKALTIYNKTYYEKELRNKIAEKMKFCSVVLIFAGVYASYSESIQMEISIALDLRKPIIAIEYWGSERTSAIVKNAADRVVKWNTNSIVDAIKEISL
jgi:hypothetical protein